jgi:hypothetical protein
MQQYGGSGGAGYQPYGGQQQAPPPAPPMGPRMSKNAILVLVFAILIIVIMGVCMFTPWYVVKSEYEDYEVESEVSFAGMKAKSEGSSVSYDWDDEMLKDEENTRNLYLITQIMVILGLVFGILILIGAILAMVGKGPGKKLAVIFGLIALIFCILAPVIFLVMHPGALDSDYEGTVKPDEGPNKSFIGSKEYEGSAYADSYKQEWGPAIGWILAWIGFIFAVICFSFALKLPKGTTSGYTTPPPPPPPSQYR